MKSITECSDYIESFPADEYEHVHRTANHNAADIMKDLELVNMSLEGQVAYLASWIGKLQAIEEYEQEQFANEYAERAASEARLIEEGLA